MRHLEQIPSCIHPCNLNVEVKRQELCAALSRDACIDKCWIHQNFSRGGDNVSCQTGEELFPELQAGNTVLEILTYVCLLQGFSADI